MTDAESQAAGPSFTEIHRAAEALKGRIIHTPTVPLVSDRIRRFLPSDTSVTVKLELFQQTGSFKARGALLAIDALDATQRTRGVTAVSAGNHALAVAWAARHESVSATLVMPEYADPVRVQGCRALGADVLLVDDIHAAFAEMDRIVIQEGRSAIHPFEGTHMILGAATCGLELVNSHPDLDAIVVPIGGGGLIAGIARASKLNKSSCTVIGVEPIGADTLYQSFREDAPIAIPKVDTIADSLGAPTALPYSFGVARANVDRIVRIEDGEMLQAMALLYDALKIAAEPACAAATAALIGPLCRQLEGQRVGVIACGSNIGEKQFAHLVEKGRSSLATRQ